MRDEEVKEPEVKDQTMPTQTLPFTLTVEPFLGFAPPAACREGIEANLKILAQHAQLVFASVSDDAETE